MLKSLNRKALRQELFLGSALAVVVVAMLSLMGFWGEHRVFELATHFKLQYLVVSTVAFAIFWLMRRRWWGMLCLVCLVANLGVVAPWYLPRFSFGSGAEGQAFRVLVANVQASNPHYERAIALVQKEKPDIAVFMEVNEAWMQALEPIRAQLPYTLAEPQSGNFGIALYSTLPLVSGEIKSFGTELPGEERAPQVPSLLAEVGVGTELVSLVATHPFPPVSQQAFFWRNRQLAAVADSVQGWHRPLVVVGDLNLTMWSPFYQRFVRQTGLRNSRRGFGVLPTWPTNNPLLSIPLDHCLVSSAVWVKRTRTGRGIGSDHLPLIVDAVVRAPSTTAS